MNAIARVAGHRDPRYADGPVKVWYARPEFGRDGRMGYEWLEEKGLLPKPEFVGNLEKTHVCIGSLNTRGLDEVFMLMQGEEWSPRGEARGYIQEFGLGHTSMSVGDVIQMGEDRATAAYFLVDGCGFRRLGGS